ncbi:MAG: M23 family metallopeptidase [Spirochaetaceae bacterium]|jgi:murein DD-endopeptidase MepM/ murein hydrolase activator NlpD|nr:M23 family metallopeptidase [Spirochaetaceae bacterium]
MNTCEKIRHVIFLAASFSLIACITQNAQRLEESAVSPGPPPAGAPPKTVKAEETEDPFWASVKENRAAVVQKNPRPGDPLTVVFYNPSIKAPPQNPPSNEARVYSVPYKAGLYTTNAEKAKKVSGGSFFPFQIEEGRTVYTALLAVPCTLEAGVLTLRIEREGGEIIAEDEVAVFPRDFAAEEIPLNPVNTGLRTVPDPKKTEQSEKLWSILNKTGENIYSNGLFLTPVPKETRRTSFFGDRRVYVYSNGKRDQAIHAGIDYGVPSGTPVYAPADGKVVLAEERIVTGNSIVIEHMPGLYSIYYHLDEIFVKEGDIVKAGWLLSKSGSTGLATGPHLHWEIRLNGENTDPDAFCSSPLLDKTALKIAVLNAAIKQQTSAEIP